MENQTTAKFRLSESGNNQSLLNKISISKYSFVFLLILTSFGSYSQTNKSMTKTLKLGDATFQIIQEYGDVNDSVLFLNVHEDEHTSIETVEEYAKSRPVHFVRIAHLKTRRLEFSINKKAYSVDPNRIYTRKGRRNTLKDGGRHSFKASKAVKQFSLHILNYLSDKSVVIAMHNNTDINYSIKSYLPDGDESENTKEVFINPERDPDDFIYTTVKSYFDSFKEMGINVILQDNEKYVNDGSLSVYCGQNGINYINIEAQKGHFDEQLELIKSVMLILDQKNN